MRGEDAQIDFANEITRRMKVDNIFVKIAASLGLVDVSTETHVFPTNFDCLSSLIESYKSNCGPLHDYDLQYTAYFVQACEKGENSAQILSKNIKKVCSSF